MTEVPAHHTAAAWASRPRRLDAFTVKAVRDCGDTVEILQSTGWTFCRSKADLKRDVHVGDLLELETIQVTRVVGLRDGNGWLFRVTNEELAEEARQFDADIRRREVEQLERNRKRYAEYEAALPEWLGARIKRFRGAAGEKFLLEGWGYELMICRLADLIDQGREAEADKLALDEGASGNQWGCAKALAAGRAEQGDGFAVRVPAGLSPITGSADYSN